MKLSNKVLVAFFALGFLYLTAVFAEVRLRGTPNVINETNSIAETAEIPGVAHLVLQNLEYSVAVMGSDKPRLEVRSVSGNLMGELKFRTSGDTLTLSSLPAAGRRAVRITVFVPADGLKGILVKDAMTSVSGLVKDTLYIEQQAGRVWLSNNQIGQLSVALSEKSRLDLNGPPVKTLSAKVDNSHLLIASPIARLQGGMDNHSMLRAGAIGEIQFKKDTTSILNIY